MSRFEIKKATRRGQKARIGLAATSGAGKTATALVLAHHLTQDEDGNPGKILVVDTEYGSAALYADSPPFKGAPVVEFDHLEWTPPFDASELVALFREVGSQYDAIILDSFSHFWNGKGGINDAVDAAARARFRNNSMIAWKEVGNPLHNDVVDAILRSPAHVIACMRTANEYEIEDGSSGKKTVKRLGTKPQARESVIYEVGFFLTMELDHKLTVSKSRFTDVDGITYPAGNVEEFATSVRNWLNTAEAATIIEAAEAEVRREIDTEAAEREGKAAVEEIVDDNLLSAEQRDTIVGVLKGIPSDSVAAAQADFKAKVGPLSELNADQFDEALNVAKELVAAHQPF